MGRRVQARVFDVLRRGGVGREGSIFRGTKSAVLYKLFPTIKAFGLEGRFQRWSKETV